MSELVQLTVTLAVTVVSGTLPKGVGSVSRKGLCVAWYMNAEDCLWLVAFDETGELVWVPQREVRLRASWSLGRRF